MRYLIYIAICTAGMTGFWYLIRFLILGVSEDFGDGFFIGCALTTVLVFLAEKADKAQKADK